MYEWRLNKKTNRWIKALGNRKVIRNTSHRDKFIDIIQRDLGLTKYQCKILYALINQCYFDEFKNKAVVQNVRKAWYPMRVFAKLGEFKIVIKRHHFKGIKQMVFISILDLNINFRHLTKIAKGAVNNDFTKYQYNQKSYIIKASRINKAKTPIPL